MKEYVEIFNKIENKDIELKVRTFINSNTVPIGTKVWFDNSEELTVQGYESRFFIYKPGFVCSMIDCIFNKETNYNICRKMLQSIGFDLEFIEVPYGQTGEYTISTNFPQTQEILQFIENSNGINFVVRPGKLETRVKIGSLFNIYQVCAEMALNLYIANVLPKAVKSEEQESDESDKKWKEFCEEKGVSAIAFPIITKNPYKSEGPNPYNQIYLREVCLQDPSKAVKSENLLNKIFVPNEQYVEPPKEVKINFPYSEKSGSKLSKVSKMLRRLLAAN